MSFIAGPLSELGTGSSHRALCHEAARGESRPMVHFSVCGRPGPSDVLQWVSSFQQNTAEAVAILMTHLFGDAFSPYLVGLVSDTLTDKYNIQTVTCKLCSTWSKGFSLDRVFPALSLVCCFLPG